jgi:succinate dehydrogenase / fumarate reductase cytochrome b subunit
MTFLDKRLQSLTGLFFSLYLIFHLFTNSQAALFIGDDGRGYIHEVNWIHNLPYLPILEIVLLGVPIVLHSFYGTMILIRGGTNSFETDGRTPSLPHARNRAYTWQKLTAYFLLVAVLLHVVHMRGFEYPEIQKEGHKTLYTVELNGDSGLNTLKDRIDFSTVEKNGKVFATADNFGTASLLMVRETFKSPLMMALYTIFVLAAVYHGLNGLWMFTINWGITVTVRSQNIMLWISLALMFITAFLGLAAIFGTYWINLRN